MILAFAAGLSLLAPGPGTAASPARDRVCHASADLDETYVEVAADPSRWRCDPSGYDWDKKRFFVRHELAAGFTAQGPVRFAEFDRHPFDRLTAMIVESDGDVKSRAYHLGDLALGKSSLVSIMSLPEVEPGAKAIIFVVDGRFPEALYEARLVELTSVRIVAGLPHLFAALLCGLLITPMVFDLGYYRALREPFPLFHALFCIMAFVQTAAVSGLIPLMTNIGFKAEMDITYLSLDLMVAATYLFAYNFIERNRLSARLRLALAALVVVTLANGVITTFWAAQIGYYVDHIYFGFFVGGLGCYFAILVNAWRRGSRAAPYLAFGLAPLALVQAAQSASVYISGTFTFDETWPQNLTLLFEVIATALAVADRFMAVRRERDKALNEARILGALSEHDDLTGLLNRRALDAHYPSLLAEGFETLAVIDIDHFKAINDIHGHPVGDAVLRCAAAALVAGDDPDVRAFRIGGEEFLLLLRGGRAEDRAEQRRRAISARVATDIQALDRPVTASMGLVDFAAVAREGVIDFSSLYSRADWLLYEAKREGRNRSRSEKLRLFDRLETDWPGRSEAAA